MVVRMLQVFDGQFTVPSDKMLIVDICVGLWAVMLVDRDAPHMRVIYDLVVSNKDKCFPEEYFDNLVPVLEATMAHSPSWKKQVEGQALRTSPCLT